MKTKHRKLLEARVNYIKETAGSKFIDDKCYEWAKEYRLNNNHNTYDAVTFMQKQLNYVYMKFARLYKEMHDGKYRGQGT